MTTKAFAYLRTSSATNVGADKDSGKRQRLAIQAYARAHHIEIAGEYYDGDVSGTEPVHGRPAFAEMMAEIASNGVRTIIVESASRFARDLVIQETGYQHLKDRGIALIAADDPEGFTADTPTAIMVRQILGAVAQFQKAELVAKLAGARLRKQRETGERCGGAPSAPAAARRLAQRLRREKLSLRKISARLAAKGFVAPSGAPYGAGSIQAMLRGMRSPK